MTPQDREYVIAALKVLLNINDIDVMKYTIESLIEKIEDAPDDHSDTNQLDNS
jgi:hypothetical protein